MFTTRTNMNCGFVPRFWTKFQYHIAAYICLYIYIIIYIVDFSQLENLHLVRRMFVDFPAIAMMTPKHMSPEEATTSCKAWFFSETGVI